MTRMLLLIRLLLLLNPRHNNILRTLTACWGLIDWREGGFGITANYQCVYLRHSNIIIARCQLAPENNADTSHDNSKFLSVTKPASIVELLF